MHTMNGASVLILLSSADAQAAHSRQLERELGIVSRGTAPFIITAKSLRAYLVGAASHANLRCRLIRSFPSNEIQIGLQCLLVWFA
jgi:hypothetical protein